MKRTLGQRAADWVTEFSGSWRFIFGCTAALIAWILLNNGRIVTFDEYPFIFLNLILTVVSTMQSPLIMMSNNRQNDADREHVREILSKLDSVLGRLDAEGHEHVGRTTVCEDSRNTV